MESEWVPFKEIKTRPDLSIETGSRSLQHRTSPSESRLTSRRPAPNTRFERRAELLRERTKKHLVLPERIVRQNGAGKERRQRSRLRHRRLIDPRRGSQTRQVVWRVIEWRSFAAGQESATGRFKATGCRKEKGSRGK